MKHLWLRVCAVCTEHATWTLVDNWVAINIWLQTAQWYIGIHAVVFGLKSCGRTENVNVLLNIADVFRIQFNFIRMIRSRSSYDCFLIANNDNKVVHYPSGVIRSRRIEIKQGFALGLLQKEPVGWHLSNLLNRKQYFYTFLMSFDYIQ